jgi:hypothetical protein
MASLECDIRVLGVHEKTLLALALRLKYLGGAQRVAYSGPSTPTWCDRPEYCKTWRTLSVVWSPSVDEKMACARFFAAPFRPYSHREGPGKDYS